MTVKEKDSSALVKMTAELVVISGRLRGHRIPLVKTLSRIGSDRKCEVMLDDSSASPVHSEILRREGELVLRDLKSANGTFLNDARIVEATLQNGDRIGVGDSVMLLRTRNEQDTKTLQVVISKEPRKVGTRFSLSLNDTRFLEIQQGTSIPDATRQFSMLYDFMVDVAGILHTPALLERSLAHIMKAFPGDRGLVLLLDAKGEPGLMSARYRDGVTDAEEIHISRTLIQQLLSTKESFLSMDAGTDGRLAASESLKGTRVISIMCVPLKVKDKILGMIYLDTFCSGYSFSENDLKLCTAMAMQLAAVVENTHLYAELLDAAEFNRSILRSLGSGIIVVDATCTVIRANRATQEITGIDESKLLGHSLDEFPELCELHTTMRAALSSGKAEDRHEVHLSINGETIPVGLSASILSDHAGKQIGVVAHFRNLSQIKKLEEQVRRAQNLAALGQMAASVAHEVRNPLNSIRGFAQLLQERAAGNTEHTEYTQIILQEVDRMNRIVQDLLDFSKQRELTLAPIELPLLLEDLIREMQPDALKATVMLELIPGKRLSSDTLGNVDKLRQVFRNIIINAIQACAAGGLVKVSYGEQALANEINGRRREAFVVISDNGCGIAPNAMPRIFEPFFTQKHTGTGLGLAISQKIVEKHGGRIGVSSEVGKGSTFTICLPM